MLHKHKKRLKYASIIILAFAVIGGGIFAYQQITRSRTQIQTPHTNRINYDTPTEEEKQAGEETKINQIENANQPPAPQPGAGDKAVITNFAQDNSTKKVTVQTELTGNNYQTCTLTLTTGSDTVTKTAEVIYQNSFSTCAGFTISAAEFPAAGTWTAKLAVKKADGSTVDSATSQATITK